MNKCDVFYGTFIFALNDDFVHALMTSLFQSIQEATEDIAGLVHDDVQKSFSCLDRLIVLGLNGLQLLQCNHVTLKHVASQTLSVNFHRHLRV